jgi:hypothetical protein
VSHCALRTGGSTTVDDSTTLYFEIAGLVAYLGSGESGYMTGSSLTIDGGELNSTESTSEILLNAKRLIATVAHGVEPNVS